MSSSVSQDGAYFANVNGVPDMPSSLVVASNAVAHFALAYHDVPVGSQQTCATVARFTVALPNATAGQAISVQGNGSFVNCGTGQVYISPFYL